MEGNVIIKSEQCDINKICKIFLCMGIASFVFCFVFCGIIDSPELYSFIKYGYYPDDLLKTCPICLVVILLAVIANRLLSSYEMVITDKRIYGKIVFGRRVDLPIDSISATGMLRILKGVSVSSASGKIRFLLIKNADQMYKEISNLLLNRQNKDTAIVTTSEEKTDTHGDLLKLKELLDMGIITQEEFEAKKKQFLGL